MSQMTQLEHALDTTEAYVAHFESQSLPVLKRTVRELDTLREDEESVSGRRIAAVILGDPLMAMRVISFLGTEARRKQNHDITTVDRAVMMMGITPFASSTIFRLSKTCSPSAPKPLIGAAGNRKSEASCALCPRLIILRHDLDVDEITLAARFCAKRRRSSWCFAPVLTEKCMRCRRRTRHCAASSPNVRCSALPPRRSSPHLSGPEACRRCWCRS